MTKIEYIKKCYSSNSLICVVFILIILLIVLFLIKIFIPDLEMGISINGHIGDLNGKFNIEGFKDKNKFLKQVPQTISSNVWWMWLLKKWKYWKNFRLDGIM